MTMGEGGIVQFELLLVLVCLIILISIAIRKTKIPLPLALVVAGMVLSFIPNVPTVHIPPDLILYLFLPLLVYQASVTIPWHDLKNNLRLIVLLSVGHVLFATLAIAWCCHTFLGINWNIGIIIGAVLSPPDDVALVSVAKKLAVPRRIVTVLAGEGLFNDATALTILKIAIAGATAHQWAVGGSILSFIEIVVSEIAYGLILGFVISEVRGWLKDLELEILVSLISPFIAYLPAVALGGSGVLATATLGFYIGQSRSRKFSAESRILIRPVWVAIGVVTESLLFLWAGLNARDLIQSLTGHSVGSLFYAGLIVSVTAVVARFIWVFPAVYLPRFLFLSIRKKDPYPPWQYPFLVSWGGMRGAICIAAALTIPVQASVIGADTKHFIVFLAFCVVVTTLLFQGLSLPVLIKWLGLHPHIKAETQDLEREMAYVVSALQGAIGYERGAHKSLALERKELARLFGEKHISAHTFQQLERSLDFKESSITLTSAEQD